MLKSTLAGLQQELEQPLAWPSPLARVAGGSAAVTGSRTPAVDSGEAPVAFSAATAADAEADAVPAPAPAPAPARLSLRLAASTAPLVAPTAVKSVDLGELGRAVDGSSWLSTPAPAGTPWTPAPASLFKDGAGASSAEGETVPAEEMDTAVRLIPPLSLCLTPTFSSPI